MATHELYIGGPPTRNYGLGMFPAVPFNDAAAGFQVGPAAHKGPAAFNDKRRLDFTGDDHALNHFLNESNVVVGDTLGVVLLPKNMLFLGFSYQVLKAVAGVALTPKIRGNALIFSAIDCSVAGEVLFVAPSGGAGIAEGVVDLGAAGFNNKPDMLDLTITAAPEGLNGLILEITPVIISTAMGGTP
jgi:hypothetical protein